MKLQTASLTIAASLVVACAGGAPPTATPGLANPTTSPAAVATPPGTPLQATPAATAALSPLEGTWTTGETTCEQQHAAVERASFTSEQQQRAGWDAETCGNLIHGAAFTIRFASERLLIFNDESVGWDGVYRVVDADTFEAGDPGNLYITYEFAIDGDELTIDMVQSDFPTTSEAELAGELLAQTVIYETSSFTREQ